MIKFAFSATAANRWSGLMLTLKEYEIRSPGRDLLRYALVVQNPPVRPQPAARLAATFARALSI